MPDSADSILHQKGPVPLVIGVTGHRELPLAKAGDGTKVIAPHIEAEVREFFARLQSDYEATPLILLSALSPGADCLVAQIALDVGIRVVPVLPVPVAEHTKSNEAAFKVLYPGSVDRFRSLLVHEGVYKQPIVMPEATCGEPGALDGNAGVSSIPHLLAGVFVARHCQILLALWDGKIEKDLRTGGCESGGRMVPGPPARLGNRHLQRGILHRVSDRAVSRCPNNGVLRLAHGLSRHRSIRSSVVNPLVPPL